MPLAAIPLKKSWNSHKGNLRFPKGYKPAKRALKAGFASPCVLATSLINKEGLKGNHGFPFGQYAL